MKFKRFTEYFLYLFIKQIILFKCFFCKNSFKTTALLCFSSLEISVYNGTLSFAQKLADSRPGAQARYKINARLWFSVTGPGLAPEQEDRIWELFISSGGGKIKAPATNGYKHNKLLVDHLTNYLRDRLVPNIEDESIPG